MTELNYAGFSRRLFAFCIDWIIIMIVLVIINNLLPGRFWDNLIANNHADFLSSLMRDGTSRATVSKIALVFYGAYWFIFYFLIALVYSVVMESAKQATIGKILFKLRVANVNGEKAAPLQIALRNVGKVLSFLTIGVGFLMVGFTSKRQALHDLLAKTVIIKN